MSPPETLRFAVSEPGFIIKTTQTSLNQAYRDKHSQLINTTNRIANAQLL